MVFLNKKEERISQGKISMRIPGYFLNGESEK